MSNLQQYLKQREEEFENNFHTIDASECEYDADGKPDNMIIISKDGMCRTGLDSVKSFHAATIQGVLEKVVEMIEKEDKKWNSNGEYYQNVSEALSDLSEEIKSIIKK